MFAQSAMDFAGVSLITKSPRIAANRSRLNSGANNPSVAVCIPHSNDALEMLVLSFARGRHMYCF